MIVFCCPKMINERSETELTWNNVKKIAGRVVAVIVPVAMQFLWYLLILKWFSKAAGLLSIVLTVLSFLFVLYINTKREESSYKTLWLIVILTFPVLGAVMYIIFGNNNTAKKLEKNITKARLHMDYELSDGEKCIGELEREDKRLAQSVKRISDATGFPMVKLDSAVYFPWARKCSLICARSLKRLRNIFLRSILFCKTASSLTLWWISWRKRRLRALTSG